LSRIPLPNEEYMKKLGAVTYSYAYLEWLAIEIIAKVLGKNMADIARNLQSTASPMLTKVCQVIRPLDTTDPLTRHR
jgi:hypothetical protein